MNKVTLDQVLGRPELKIYEICDNGDVISNYRQNPIVLKPGKDHKGYLRVSLKDKTYKVHRLVAMAFIENVDNKPQVNHKDGNKQNNNVDNLEWCTNSENQIHANKMGLRNPMRGEDNYQYNKEHKNCKKVIQRDLITNEIIGEYFSQAQAARAVGAKSYSTIAKACKGEYKQAHGYKWEYKQ